MEASVSEPSGVAATPPPPVELDETAFTTRDPNPSITENSQAPLINQNDRISFDAADILSEANLPSSSGVQEKNHLDTIDDEDEEFKAVSSIPSESETNHPTEEKLSRWLVYYQDFEDNYGEGKNKKSFASRSEVSIMSTRDDFENDPEGYLFALLDKYNVEHSIAIEEESDREFHPWIQGVLYKKLPNQGVFGRDRWSPRLFRLYDEALIWFSEPTVLSGIMKHVRTLTRTKSVESSENDSIGKMSPLGVLPLAMVTSITASIPSGDRVGTQQDEDELLTFDLEIGSEGRMILRCEDWRQRIKWVQCLNAAVFNMARPLFASRAGIWRLGEEAPSEDVEAEARKGRLVQMGRSLVLTITDVDLSRDEDLEVERGMSEDEDGTGGDVVPQLNNLSSGGRSTGSAKNTPRTSKVL